VHSATCTICDVDVGAGHHACFDQVHKDNSPTQREMRKVWCLPEESKIHYTGSDWFLLVLASLSTEQRKQISFSYCGEPSTCETICTLDRARVQLRGQ
jgi:hypothetical protein